MRGVCPFCNRSKTVCWCLCVTVCTNDATGTVWVTPGLEQLLSREHRLPLSGLKFKTKSADNDPASHCIREAGCHWQDQVTGYEQALPCVCSAALGLPVIMTAVPHPRGPLAHRPTHPLSSGQKGGASHSPCWMNPGQVSASIGLVACKRGQGTQ